MSNYTKKPFDLEYMKAHPETQLGTEDGKVFVDYKIWEDPGSYCFITAFENSCNLHHFKIQSKGDVWAKGSSVLVMLVPCVENVYYANVYEKHGVIGCSYSSINNAKKESDEEATHIVKLTTSEDQAPTFEIVYTY